MNVPVKGPSGATATLRNLSSNVKVRAVKEQLCKSWGMVADIHALVCQGVYLDDDKRIRDYELLRLPQRGLQILGRPDLPVDLVVESNGCLLPVSVCGDDPVYQIKKDLHQAFGLPVEAQSLTLLDGTPLYDDKSIVFYSLTPGSTIQLSAVSASRRTKVRVMGLDTKVLPLTVLTSTRVWDLKVTIGKKLFMSPTDIELIYGKTVLKDEFTLAQYNPPKGDFLVCLVKADRSLTVLVKHAEGADDYKFSGLVADDSVLRLKEEIQNMMPSFAVERQMIKTEGGVIMDDQKNLGDYGMTRGRAKVHLSIADPKAESPEKEPVYFGSNEQFKISIENQSGEKRTLHVYPTQSISELKEVYSRLTGVLKESLHLFHEDVELMEGARVHHTALEADSIVTAGVSPDALPPGEADSMGTFTSNISTAFLSANIQNMTLKYESEANGDCNNAITPLLVPSSPAGRNGVPPSPAMTNRSLATTNGFGNPSGILTSYHIYVQRGAGKVLEMEFESPGTTVFAVKGMVEDLWGVSPCDQIFVYRGEILSDVRSLRSYNVPAGATIHMAVAEEDVGDINVAVETIPGKRIFVSMCHGDTVEKLRRKVLRQQSVPDVEALCARFFYNGDWMSDEKAMQDYDVCNGGIILMMRPRHADDEKALVTTEGSNGSHIASPSKITTNYAEFLEGLDARHSQGPITVIVRNRVGKHLKITSVSRDSDVMKLKQKIAEEWEVPVAEQRLYLDELCLRDKTTISQAGIPDFGVIRLATVRRSVVGIPVTVETVGGEKVCVHLDGNHSSDDILRMVEEALGVDATDATTALFFNGTYLAPGRPVSGYGVKVDSTLIQTVRASPSVCWDDPDPDAKPRGLQGAVRAGGMDPMRLK